MKIINKILVILILLSIVNIFVNITYAKELSEMMDEASGFVSKGKEKVDGKLSDEIENITSEFLPIGQLLTMIGTGVMVAVTTFMGIKYLTSGPDAQAKLKQQLIGVVVSGIVIFGAHGIWKMVINIVKNFE